MMMCRISPLVASLQAAHAMGPMTFGRRVVAALLLITMASIGAAASIETQRLTEQTRIDLVDVPRGLPDIGSAACHDARSFCAKTVLRALHEDENLTGFLDNVRKLAKEAGNPGSADGYAVAVIDPTSLKLPEMLALGCCLNKISAIARGCDSPPILSAPSWNSFYPVGSGVRGCPDVTMFDNGSDLGAVI